MSSKKKKKVGDGDHPLCRGIDTKCSTQQLDQDSIMCLLLLSLVCFRDQRIWRGLLLAKGTQTMEAQKPHNANPLNPSMRGIALSSRLEQLVTHNMPGFNQKPCNYKYRLCSDGKHNIVFIISIIENYCQCLSFIQKTIVSFFANKTCRSFTCDGIPPQKLSVILDLYVL